MSSSNLVSGAGDGRERLRPRTARSQRSYQTIRTIRAAADDCAEQVSRSPVARRGRLWPLESVILPLDVDCDVIAPPPARRLTAAIHDMAAAPGCRETMRGLNSANHKKASHSPQPSALETASRSPGVSQMSATDRSRSTRRPAALPDPCDSRRR